MIGAGQGDNGGDAAARHAAGVADAVQVGAADPAGCVLRTEVGRLPVDLLPRRRRGRAGQPQRAADDPVLPRTGRRGRAPSFPQRCVIDGEIVIATDHGLDFEALQQRIHPAESRVRMLAEQTPASFIAFDLLALGDDDYTARPFASAAPRLVDALAGCGPIDPRHAGDDGSRTPRSAGSTSSRAPASTASSPSR